MNEHDEALAHVQARVTEARIQLEPYRHLCIDGILPNACHDEPLDRFPTPRSTGGSSVDERVQAVPPESTRPGPLATPNAYTSATEAVSLAQATQ